MSNHPATIRHPSLEAVRAATTAREKVERKLGRAVDGTAHVTSSIPYQAGATDTTRGEALRGHGCVFTEDGDTYPESYRRVFNLVTSEYEWKPAVDCKEMIAVGTGSWEQPE